MCTIVQDPNPMLRKTAISILPEKIQTAQLQHTITEMKQALHKELDGVALAAPQIGESLRLFIVAGFVFDLKQKNKGGTKSLDRVFINPEIIKKSKKTAWVAGEGCLSIRWKYGTVKRHKQITVRAYDESGKQFTFSASGLVAQIVQHEIDHLNGILFTDTAKDVKPMTPEEIVEYQKELAEMARS